MASFIDVSCPKCGRKYGWFGEMKDRPKCPKCGHQVPYDPEEEKKFQSALDELRDKMLRQKGLSELMRPEKQVDDMKKFLKGEGDVPDIS